MKTIGIVAEYSPSFEPHLATSRAIEHSALHLDLQVGFEWVSTADIDATFFRRYHGLWVAPGSPYRDMQKTLDTIRIARENGIPTFGTCGGFQHIMLEYARNLLRIEDAAHAEYDPYASQLFISQLACSLAGREMELSIVAGSRAHAIYQSEKATERYYCNFAVNPDYLLQIKNGPISISGSDAEGETRIVEYADHPFFIATLFVPQTKSTPEAPHPLVSAFLQAL